MNVDCIIVGQGICGTWLSYFLSKSSFRIIVIDNNKLTTSSKTAAGVINPVTGRRYVTTWLMEELLQNLKTECAALEEELQIPVLSKKNVLDFFPTRQSQSAFEERLKTNQPYLRKPSEKSDLFPFFKYDYGYGEITSCFLFNLAEVLCTWRKKLQAKNVLLEEEFDYSKLSINGKTVNYKNIVTEKIIFCEGVSAMQNPFFHQLPFSFNKGERLLIESNEIPQTHIYKKGIVVVPQGNNLFWVGSNYLWDFKNENPSVEFFDKTKKQLQDWFKYPFKIVDHKAAIRPANLERRPFVGFHPFLKNVGILNGMGTKGCSLAPYFANQLLNFMKHNTPIHPEADVARFKNILR